MVSLIFYSIYIGSVLINWCFFCGQSRHHKTLLRDVWLVRNWWFLSFLIGMGVFSWLALAMEYRPICWSIYPYLKKELRMTEMLKKLEE